LKSGRPLKEHQTLFSVDTFRNDTSGYTPELKWSVLKVLLKVSTAKTGCHGSVSKIPYYLRGSVLKVSTAQGISSIITYRQQLHIMPLKECRKVILRLGLGLPTIVHHLIL
jgi:hypothetical protein